MPHQEKTPLSASEAAEARALLQAVSALRTQILTEEAEASAQWQHLHPTYQASARNLLHYIGLRQHDIRPLQERLAALGLSSLGRSEAHVLSTLSAILRLLRLLNAEETDTSEIETERAIGYAEGQALLEAHTQTLLGPHPPQRHVRIMITMPSEAAEDAELVRSLLASGMDCMRINCAHDDADAWAKMVAHLRRAEAELGKRCRILMDLAGPKLRTGAVEAKPSRVKWKPPRKSSGEETTQARIWLSPASTGKAPEPADAVVPVAGSGFDLLQSGDVLAFQTADGTWHRLVIAEKAEGGCWATCEEKASVTSGAPLQHQRRASTSTAESTIDLHVAELPPTEQSIRLQHGDTLLLTRDPAPGKAAEYGADGRVLHPAHIPCLPADILADIHPGERIWLDDGKFGGVIRRATRDSVQIEITQAPANGGRLRAEKGINLPDSHLQIAIPTAKDREDLQFAVEHADMIGISFVQRAGDVEELLASLGERRPGIVLKIETKRGFNALPELLLAAMQTASAGVMIARGDLAVEVGFERLSEVQEEILWICEAAHMPVIWATQVLENLAQTGMPSRAEITDAAMGVRAECVMLNKGPYMVDTVRTLDDILQRMQTHLHKKRTLLRALHAWR